MSFFTSTRSKSRGYSNASCYPQQSIIYNRNIAIKGSSFKIHWLSLVKNKNSCHKHYSQSQLLCPSFYRGNFPLELSPKGSKSMSKEFEYSWSSTLQHCKSWIKNNNFTNESTKHFPLTNQSFEGIHKIIIAPLKMLILSPSKTKEFQDQEPKIL